MKKIQLAKSPVQFTEEDHKYWMDGDQLSGITKIISKYIFPDMYKGVDEKTLNAAAEHGHKVHAQVQMLVNDKWTIHEIKANINTLEPEVIKYVELVQKNKIKMMCSEYLVSDTMWVASSIDLVDKNLNLYDIKTTSEFHREYVRWQLSIYAYLFELQNPDLKVGQLYGIHLRDGARLIEVERIPDEIIRALLYDTFAAGKEEFDNPLNSLGEDEDELMFKLKAAQENRKYWEDEEKRLKEEVSLAMLTNNNTLSVVKDKWKVTKTPATTSVKFDEKAFKAKKPSIWRKFLKESKVGGRLTITFYDENDDENP